MRMNLDTGAARSVSPETAEYGERLKQEKVINFRTATGEVVPSSGDLKVDAWDEWGRHVRFPGTLAPVHKPLIAADQVTDKGNDIWFYDNEAYVIEKGSRVQKRMRQAFEDAMEESMGNNTVRVYKENGVYNMYVQPETIAGKRNVTQTTAVDLCAGEQAGVQGPLSGGSRQGHCL